MPSPAWRRWPRRAGCGADPLRIRPGSVERQHPLIRVGGDAHIAPGPDGQDRWDDTYKPPALAPDLPGGCGHPPLRGWEVFATQPGPAYTFMCPPLIRQGHRPCHLPRRGRRPPAGDEGRYRLCSAYRPTPVRASPCHPLPGEGFSLPIWQKFKNLPPGKRRQVITLGSPKRGSLSRSLPSIACGKGHTLRARSTNRGLPCPGDPGQRERTCQRRRDFTEA